MKGKNLQCKYVLREEVKITKITLGGGVIGFLALDLLLGGGDLYDRLTGDRLLGGDL